MLLPPKCQCVSEFGSLRLFLPIDVAKKQGLVRVVYFDTLGISGMYAYERFDKALGHDEDGYVKSTLKKSNILAAGPISWRTGQQKLLAVR